MAGALNTPRSPQGRPVYAQAGSSEDGRTFAARHAEAVFTAHQTLADAQAFYADIRERARTLGRDPDHVKVLPGISPFVASTEREARELEEGFNVMPPHLPGGFDAFVDHVVPLLRDRGLFREKYTGTTLREHYGLTRPSSGFASPVAQERSILGHIRP